MSLPPPNRPLGTFTPGQQRARDVLVARAAEGFTGRVEMTSSTGDVASLWFASGMLAATAVPGPRPRLGLRLLSAGLLRPEALDRVLRAQAADPHAGPVGELLVHNGAVDASEVDRFVRVQAIDQVSDLLGWDLIGTAGFPDDQPPAALTEPLMVSDALAEAEHRREAWEGIVMRIGGPHGVPQLSMLAAPRANLLLGPYDWAVLTKVDGMRDLETLADHCGLSLYEIAQILNGLCEVGLVVLPAPVPARPVNEPPKRRLPVDAASLLRELSALKTSPAAVLR